MVSAVHRQESIAINILMKYFLCATAMVVTMIVSICLPVSDAAAVWGAAADFQAQEERSCCTCPSQQGQRPAIRRWRPIRC